MRDDGERLVREGITSREEVLRVTRDYALSHHRAGAVAERGVRNYGWWMLGVVSRPRRAPGAGAGHALPPEVRCLAWLKLPLVGKLARGYNAARFASTLAMLAAAGVPILRALQAAAETLSNRAMRADALDALVLVREGAPLASAHGAEKTLSRAGLDVRAPGRADRPVAADAAARGQPAGGRSAAPRHAPGHHPRAAAHRGDGRVVMLIVLAVLLPIIQLNQFVK
jgi:general secretion pathway protein F